MIESSCEICGWAAAVGSMLAFGSFGVPIKSDAATKVDINPLVFQSYKTAMCLLTCWVGLLFGQRFTFTMWGIVSGLFWVPGGVATVYAVKAAGLAVGIGIASSCIVLVSFTWGIFVFHEPVRSVAGATFAVFLMIVGIIGMSYFSSPSAAAAVPENDAPIVYKRGYTGLRIEDMEMSSASLAGDENDDIHPKESEPDSLAEPNGVPSSPSSPTGIERRRYSRRVLGICAAVFNGTWGGSIMVPMQWAPPGTSGIGYLISFAVGASLITLLLWGLLYLFQLGRQKSFRRAYSALPSLHVRTMWVAGSTSGLLWSIGNFFSLISVKYLGEGVGYSVVQAAMIVSGLWGIFYFREVTGRRLVTLWFLSAFTTVSGIVFLGYQHTGGS